MSGRETIIRPVPQKNWRGRLEHAPTWPAIGTVAAKVCGLVLAFAGWCWLSGMMPALIQALMMVPVAVVVLMAVVYGIPLAVFASGMLFWAISRDAMRLYDRGKGTVGTERAPVPSETR